MYKRDKGAYRKVLNKLLNKWTISSGVVVLALILGFAFGRYTKPSKVITIETKTQVDTETLKQITDQIRSEVLNEMQQFAQQVKTSSNQEVKKHTTTIKKPDGTVITTTNSDTKTDTKTDVKTDTKTVVDKQVLETVKKSTEDTKTHVFEESKIKIVDNQKPNWYAGIHAGYFLKDVKAMDFGYNSLIIGGEIERRVFGPIFVGGWGDSRGAAGLGIHIEF